MKKRIDFLPLVIEPAYTRQTPKVDDNVSSSQPLLKRNLDDAIAQLIRSAPLTATTKNTGRAFIRVDEFLSQVDQIARQLPEHSFAINLCRDRYQFLLSFCAIIVRGQCNLLPPNKNIVTQQDIAQSYHDVYVVHDGTQTCLELAHVDITQLAIGDERLQQIPEIPLDQICAISFTSGSTGQSTANPKTWRALWQGAILNSRYYLDNASSPQSMLATVPAQHMYGLESSVLIPLFANIRITNNQPLFPADICASLTAIPAPRILVTTPTHMRSIVNARLDYPNVALLVSATAPLETELAASMETLFKGKLREVYGCSEAGSLARRHTVHNELWECFDAFEFSHHGDQLLLSAPYLPQQVPLQDILEFTDKQHFRLRGRQGDMINIAGKRGSLVALNQLLMNTPGVVDGVVFEPPAQGEQVQRLAALVVAPELSAGEIAAHFRTHVDAVFIPRPIVFVDSLPRAETGKLPYNVIIECFNAHRLQKTTNSPGLYDTSENKFANR